VGSQKKGLKGATDNAEHLSLFVLVRRGAILPFQAFSHIRLLVVKIKHPLSNPTFYFQSQAFIYLYILLISTNEASNTKSHAYKEFIKNPLNGSCIFSLWHKNLRRQLLRIYKCYNKYLTFINKTNRFLYYHVNLDLGRKCV
jgi:hypothetical protein